MKRLVVIFVLLAWTCTLHGQIVDTTRVFMSNGEVPMMGSEEASDQGYPHIVTGTVLLSAGVTTMAISALGMWYFYKATAGNPWVAPFVVFGAPFFTLGFASSITGVGFVSSGIALDALDVPRASARFRGAGQKGLSFIIDGAALYGATFTIRNRTSVGYNLNQCVFLGGGIAPGFSYDLNSIRPTLPIYAEARVSIGSRYCSPFLGLAFGMELFDSENPYQLYPFPYMSIEAGCRYRLSRSKPDSMWFSLMIEASDEGVVGLKYGRSF